MSDERDVEILPPERPHLGGPPSGRTFDPAGRTIDAGPRRSGAWNPFGGGNGPSGGGGSGGGRSGGGGARGGCFLPFGRLFFFGLLVAGVLLLGFGSRPPATAAAVVDWLRAQGPLGMAAMVAGVALSTPLFVPSGILAILPGYVWGTATGTALVVVGAAIGGALNIVLARRMLGARVDGWVQSNPMLAALRQSIASRGFRIALGLRLSPVAPYALLAYLAGIAGLRIRTFVLASLLGGIPWTSVYAAFGAFLAAQRAAVTLDAPPESTATTALRVVGLLFTVAVAWWIGRVAKRDIDRIRQGG